MIMIISVILAGSLTYYYYIQTLSYYTPTVFTSQARVHEYVTEYQIQPGSYPNAITTDSQGNVWFALQNTTSLAELTPSNGTVHLFRPPELKSTGLTTWGIFVDNSKHVVWFTDANTNSIWSFNVASGNSTEYHIQTQFAFPYQIAQDGKGNVWFTELFGNKIGEITTSGALEEYPVPKFGNVSDVEPSGITIDQESNSIWFTETAVDAVGSYFDGRFNSYNLSGLVQSPAGIAVDSNGNLWMTQHGPSFISEFNPTTHYFRTISTSVPSWVPDNTSLPYFIQVDSQGDVWFNEHYGNAIASFDPSGNSLTEFEVPSRVVQAGNNAGVLTIGLSPNGEPWFTELFTGKVGTIDTSLPLKVAISVNNGTASITNNPVIIAGNGKVSLHVMINNESNQTLTLESFLGNYTTGFHAFLTPYVDNKNGAFNSTLVLDNNATRGGVYYLTVSAISTNLVVSQVIEIEVTS